MAKIYIQFKGGIKDGKFEAADFPLLNFKGEPVAPEHVYIDNPLVGVQIYALDKEIPFAKNSYTYVYDPTLRVSDYIQTEEDIHSNRVLKELEEMRRDIKR